MRLLWPLLTVLAVVKAQVDLAADLPSCSLECMIAALPSTNCNATDVQCFCMSEPLWQQVEPCALLNCTIKDALTSKRIATEMCNLPTRDRSNELRTIGPTLCAVSLLLLVIRLTARMSGATGMVGWDDAIITAAFAMGVPIAFFTVWMAKYGLGQDIWMVPFPSISNMLRLFWLCQLFYIFSVNLTKIALLLFFLRVFPQLWFQRWCYTMLVIVALFATAYALASAFQCTPVDYTWNQWDGEHKGTCVNVKVGAYVNASINMLLDLMILLMPMPLLLKLHITYSWKRRANILVMFSFGVCVTVVSALRVSTLITFDDSMNPTWDFNSIGTWSVIEIYVGIMCACLPACRSFFTHVLPPWLGFSVADSSGNDSGPASHGPATTPIASRSKTPKTSTLPSISSTSFPDRSCAGSPSSMTLKMACRCSARGRARRDPKAIIGPIRPGSTVIGKALTTRVPLRRSSGHDLTLYDMIPYDLSKLGTGAGMVFLERGDGVPRSLEEWKIG